VVFHHPNYLDVETHYLSTEIKTKAIKREDDFWLRPLNVANSLGCLDTGIANLNINGMNNKELEYHFNFNDMFEKYLEMKWIQNFV